MKSCRRASELVSKSLDGPLTRGEMISMRGHILICRYCRRYRKHINWLRGVLRGVHVEAKADPEHTLAPEARTRMQNAIREAT